MLDFIIDLFAILVIITIGLGFFLVMFILGNILLEVRDWQKEDQEKEKIRRAKDTN